MNLHGNNYQVCQVDKFPHYSTMEYWGLTTDSPIEEWAAKMKWGTYGIPARQPAQWKYLSDLETDHLYNILITERWIPQIHTKTILYILGQRLSSRNVVVSELLHSQKQNKDLRIKLAALGNKADAYVAENAKLRLKLSKAENEAAIDKNKIDYLLGAGRSTDGTLILLKKENEELKEKNGHTKDYLSTVEVLLARAKDEAEYLKLNRESVAENFTQLEKLKTEKLGKQVILTSGSMCEKANAETVNEELREQRDQAREKASSLLAENTKLCQSRSKLADQLNDRKEYTDYTMRLSQQITEMQTKMQIKNQTKLSWVKRLKRFINSV